MLEKDKVVNLIDFWQKAALANGLRPRALLDKINVTSREVVDIIGPRRSGKSALLKLIYKKTAPLGAGMFINFEDPFFIENGQPQVIEDIIKIYREYFSPDLKYVFFDEIQNITGWERAVHKLREGGGIKVFITGSSAKLLSRELATLLTGRHLSYNLLPLSFPEFLAFNNVAVKSKKDLVLQSTKLKRLFDEYLRLGGFPEVALTKNEELLKQYYLDILNKDIVGRYNIRQKSAIEKLGIYLISNSAKIISVASLKKSFGLSFRAASAYVDYFKEAMLILELPLFSYSLKTQQKSLKKIYSTDVGLARSVSFRFSEERGRMLENCVFLKLQSSTGKELYYYKTKNGSEVDFLIKQGRGKELAQVCVSLEDEKTKKREVAALMEAMGECGINNGLIITDEEKDEIKIGKKMIKIVPIYEWLLN